MVVHNLVKEQQLRTLNFLLCNHSKKFWVHCLGSVTAAPCVRRAVCFFWRKCPSPMASLEKMTIKTTEIFNTQLMTVYLSHVRSVLLQLILIMLMQSIFVEYAIKLYYFITTESLHKIIPMIIFEKTISSVHYCQNSTSFNLRKKKNGVTLTVLIIN